MGGTGWEVVAAAACVWWNLHAPNEASDNIVAFWVPEELPPSRGPRSSSPYKLHWFINQIHPPAGFVVATRQGHSQTYQPELHLFVIDFTGGGLEKEKPDSGIEAKVKVGPELRPSLHLTVQKNPFDETWRAVLALRPDGSGHPVELSCFLHRASHALTETWAYLWSP